MKKNFPDFKTLLCILKSSQNFLGGLILTSFISLNSNAQTYNIPSASGSSSSYVGTITGDLNIKSTAGNLRLNTIGSASFPNLGINLEGNVGIGILPPLNPTSGYFKYQPYLTISGLSGNNNEPVTSPRLHLKLISTNYTNSTLGFGLLSNGSFIQSEKLYIYSNIIHLGANNANSTLEIGKYGTVIDGDLSSNSVIKGNLIVGFGGASVSAPSGYGLIVGKGILTEQVKVAIRNTTDWSDFVFDKQYKLRTLAEVEQFINNNKHLPDVPSAEDVVKSGINLGQMDAKLLQKIEELTLYLIDLKKENESLVKRIEQLETKTGE